MKFSTGSIKLGLAVLISAAFAGSAHAQTLEDALDTLGVLTFSVETLDYQGNPVPGNAGWFGQTDVNYDTFDAAEASGLPVGSYTRLDATIQGPATLSFWWKVSTANPLERLGFSSEEDFDTITGNVDWQQRTVQIGCGEQVVSWFLDISDISTDPNAANAAWLDQIVVTPQPDEPAVQAGLDNATVEFYSDDWIDATIDQISGVPRNGTVAKSGPVLEGQSSTMIFDVEGPFEISFDWGIETNPNAFESSFRFEVDGSTRADLFGSEALTPRSFEYGPGVHCMSFTFSRAFPFEPDPDNPEPPYTGRSEGFVDNMVITQIPPSAFLANAVDVSSKVFGGAWFRQSQVTHDGVDAASVTNPTLDEGETMYVELPDDPGLISLWFKLSTEVNFGVFDAWVDGDYIGRFTGEHDWTKIEANLGQGNNRVLWLVYTHFSGGTGDAGANTVWVDQIELKPGVTNYQPDLSIKAPKGGSWKGSNRYNGNGVNQIAKLIASRRRPFGKFKLRVQNDSPTDQDSMKFYGTRGNKNFDIFYIVKIDGNFFNISADFQTGNFSTDTLEVLQSEGYEVWISAKDGYRRRSQTARVRAVSETDPSKSDVIKAKLRIPRR